MFSLLNRRKFTYNKFTSTMIAPQTSAVQIKDEKIKVRKVQPLRSAAKRAIANKSGEPQPSLKEKKKNKLNPTMKTKQVKRRGSKGEKAKSRGRLNC